MENDINQLFVKAASALKAMGRVKSEAEIGRILGWGDSAGVIFGRLKKGERQLKAEELRQFREAFPELNPAFFEKGDEETPLFLLNAEEHRDGSVLDKEHYTPQLKSLARSRLFNIIEAIKEKEGFKTDNSFLEANQLHSSLLADLKAGRAKEPSEKLILTLVEKYKVNPLWIFYGTGERFQQTQQAPKILKNGVDLTDIDHSSGKDLRLSTITVDEAGTDNIVFVNTKAAAGYLQGLEKPEYYFPKLPAFKIPMPQFRNGTFRMFAVKGQSMAPEINPGELVICRLLVDWTKEIRDGQVHVVVSSVDVEPVVKLVVNRIKERGQLSLQSLNPEFTTYAVDVNEIKEVWYVVSHIRFNISYNKERIMGIISELRANFFAVTEEMKEIKRALKKFLNKGD